LGIVKKKTKEQMNKDFNSFMTVVIMMIVVGAFVGLLIEPYPLPLEFNPDTDVCLEWKECKTINYLGECKEWRNINFPDGLHKCFEWRPKNKCELDPESEGCICDEWKGNYGDCSGKIIFYPDAYLIEKNISWSENRNITIGLKECLDEGWCECRGDYIIKKTNCIKAHEPVCKEECEYEYQVQEGHHIYLHPWESDTISNFENITVTNVDPVKCYKEHYASRRYFSFEHFQDSNKQDCHNISVQFSNDEIYEFKKPYTLELFNAIDRMKEYNISLFAIRCNYINITQKEMIDNVDYSNGRIDNDNDCTATIYYDSVLKTNEKNCKEVCE